MTAVIASPARTSNPPPTGWLMLVVHALAAGFGALLAAVAVFTQTVTGPVPRSVLIIAATVIFVAAFWSYVLAHSKVVAADEARFLVWLGRHGPDFQAALTLVHDFAGSLPPNLALDLADARSTANQAITLARTAASASTATPDTAGIEARVLGQLLARLSQPGGQGQAVVTPASVIQAPNVPPAV